MLRLWSIDFDPMWSVPYGLIILAPSRYKAKKIAEGEGVIVTGIKELPMKEGVVFFEDGNY